MFSIKKQKTLRVILLLVTLTYGGHPLKLFPTVNAQGQGAIAKALPKTPTTGPKGQGPASSSRGTVSMNRPRMSESDIRSKLKELGQGKYERAAGLAKKAMAKKAGAAKASDLPQGDISKNDPSAPETRGKLKSALAMGGGPFGDKEKQVLAQILNK